MPIHDWSRVDAGIFHHFHQKWIGEIADALNNGLLPEEYYAMEEQYAGGFGPDVLALREIDHGQDVSLGSPGNGVGLVLAPPKVKLTGESSLEFYRRQQSLIAVHHVSGDDTVAMVEVVSQGNKSSRIALRDFVEKAARVLARGIHLLILDIQPPGRRDPEGVHAVIWEELTGQEYSRPVDKPFTLAAYESGTSVRYFVEPVALGDVMRDMPLFLTSRAHVAIPVEQTYLAAFAKVPQRWRRVLEA